MVPIQTAPLFPAQKTPSRAVISPVVVPPSVPGAPSTFGATAHFHSALCVRKTWRSGSRFPRRFRAELSTVFGVLPIRLPSSERSRPGPTHPLRAIPRDGEAGRQVGHTTASRTKSTPTWTPPCRRCDVPDFSPHQTRIPSINTAIVWSRRRPLRARGLVARAKCHKLPKPTATELKRKAKKIAFS